MRRPYDEHPPSDLVQFAHPRERQERDDLVALVDGIDLRDARRHGASGEEYYVDSLYELNRAQIMQAAQMRWFLPGVAARRKTESAGTATSPTIGLYVITAERDLTPIQIVRAAQGWRTPIFGSLHSPEPGIEVRNCTLEESNLALAEARIEVVDWWMKQPIAVLAMLPWFWLPCGWFLAGLVLSPLVIAVVATGTLWGVFYLLRWVARGFMTSS